MGSSELKFSSENDLRLIQFNRAESLLKNFENTTAEKLELQAQDSHACLMYEGPKKCLCRSFVSW